MSTDSIVALATRGTLCNLKAMLLGLVRGTRANLQTLTSWRPGWKDLAELVLILSALPLYYMVRGQAHERIDDAVQRGISIVNFEKSLGIFWEVQLQSWILPYDWMVTLLNGFYLYGHLPIIGVLAVWMYFWHRPQYLLMRNAFLLSGAIGLVIFLNFPTAPPRLLGTHGIEMGFVDTIFREYHTGRPDTPSFFVNEYAAMPSLHLGWNLLAGIAVWQATKNVFLRTFAVVMPLAMYADIVLTANHYIVDGVAGFGVMLTGLAIAVVGRWLVLRVLSPDSRSAKQKGWVSWLYWLFGVAETEDKRSLPTGQPA